MKRKPSRTALATISLLCVVLLTACSSGSPFLRNVTISPTSASIDAAINDSNNTQQYTAMGFYSDGTQKDVTSQVSWASSNSGVAAIDANGLATAANPPDTTTVTITGSIGGSAATGTLTVVHAIQSIAVTPTAPSIPLGLTQQFVAKGIYKNVAGATHVEDVSSISTWASSKTDTATIDGTGLATSAFTGAVPGMADITATVSTVTSPAAVLTVTAPVVTGLKVSPFTGYSTTIAVGSTTYVTALELKTDGTTGPLTGVVTWSLPSACAPAGSVMLVGTNTSGKESAAGILAGTCTVKATEGTLTGTTTVTVVAGSTHFAYVSNSGGTDRGIGGYAVTASAATPLVPFTPPSKPSVNYVPVQSVVHPNGKYLYEIDDSSQIHLYTVDGTTGALTLADPTTIPVGGTGTLNYAVVDPTGRFLYIVDDGASTIDAFVLNQTDGTLGVKTQLTGLNGPEYVVTDRLGKFLYVFSDDDKIYAFNINQADGTLTASSTPTYSLAAGSFPVGATIDPSNKYLYTANVGTNTVSAFTIGANGILGNPTTLTVTGATAVDKVVVDPTSTHLYVLDSGDNTVDPIVNGAVYAYAIGTNGALGAAVAGSPFPAGVSPIGSIVIDPTGTLLAVDNNGVDPTTGSISLYKIGTGGVLAPTTPATVATGDSPLFVTFFNAP